MATSRNKKSAILTLLDNDVSSQKSVLLLTTSGSEKSLDAASNYQFRSKARQNGVIIKVVKNTLISKSFSSVEKLSGPTYLAYLANPENSDEITVPKSVVGIVNDDFKENFKIVGSVVNGEFLNAQDTITLSKTPSLKDSMAMVAGSINQIMAKIAIGIKEIPSSLARGVNEVQSTKS